MPVVILKPFARGMSRVEKSQKRAVARSVPPRGTVPK